MGLEEGVLAVLLEAVVLAHCRPHSSLFRMNWTQDAILGARDADPYRYPSISMEVTLKSMMTMRRIYLYYNADS